MHRAGTRAAFFVLLFGFAVDVAAELPVLVPCDDPPAAVLALGAKSAIEAFGIAPEAAVSVAAMASPGDGTESVLRFNKAGNAQKEAKLGGRVLGLLVTPDGKSAYAVVRATNRKGAVRSVELVRVDLETGRVSAGPTIPSTARGLAFGAGGSTLLVASRDEIRSLKLPGLMSGPLYRVLGDNVGIAPIRGSSFVIVAQSLRVVLADLAGPQGRDGLVLSQEVPAPAPLRGMLASAGEKGPVALSEGGLAWCVQAAAPPLPSPIQGRPAEPELAPVAAQPAPDPAASEAPAAVAPAVEPPPAVRVATEIPAEPGTVSGVVAGPALVQLVAIVLLGPDNVLREAARIVPDDKGRFVSQELPPGAYRIVAAGKGGRVLICAPPFITIRVDSNGAVEAPVLKVLRAQ